jgi:hypothetical protein
MERCERCGNEYDKCIEIVKDGQRHAFDCFECAVDALAPRCAHCGVRIIGHGLEADNVYFCCAHCAEAKGVSAVRDRAGSR